MNVQFLEERSIGFFAAEAPPSLSGSGIMAHRFAQQLKKYAAVVEMVCFNYNNKLKKEDVIDNVAIKRVSYFNRNLFFKLISLPGLLYSYFKKSGLYDISFIYGAYMPGFEFLILMNLVRGKTIIFVSTLFYEDDINTLLSSAPLPLRMIRKFLFRRISLYYAINESFKQSWERVIGTKVPIFLSTQGVDRNTFYPIEYKQKLKLKKEFSFAPKSFIILSVGFLIERKGYRHIFDMLAKLDIPFLYVIAGSLSSDLYHRSSPQELCEMDSLYKYGKQKLNNKVVFLGSQRQMQPFYSCADIVLHGAHSEGTPNVVLEAMACQKPLIVKQLEGLDFLLKDNENALLYNSPEKLNSKIKKLASDSLLAERIARNANATIQENHSIETIARRILEHINEKAS